MKVLATAVALWATVCRESGLEFTRYYDRLAVKACHVQDQDSLMRDVTRLS